MTLMTSRTLIDQMANFWFLASFILQRWAEIYHEEKKYVSLKISASKNILTVWQLLASISSQNVSL